MTEQPPILTITKKVFPVVEVFGPTIQGEGALAGSISHFIRFGGCDFSCRWCDSAHAVLAENVRKLPKLTVTDIMQQVGTLMPADWVTISGGNPALHDLDKLVGSLNAAGYRVAVETQGSKWKPWLARVDMLTISPKPPSSGMMNEGLDEFVDEVYKYYGPHYDSHDTRRDQVCFKVPCYDDTDLDFAERVHKLWPHVPFYISVVTEMGGLHGNFAEGRIDDAGSLLARYNRIAESVLRRPDLRDARVIPQLHYLLWGNITGV
jgi:7-carboxy-7-deazaguanine synthase